MRQKYVIRRTDKTPILLEHSFIENKSFLLKNPLRLVHQILSPKKSTTRSKFATSHPSTGAPSCKVSTIRLNLSGLIRLHAVAHRQKSPDPEDRLSGGHYGFFAGLHRQKANRSRISRTRHKLIARTNSNLKDP